MTAFDFFQYLQCREYSDIRSLRVNIIIINNYQFLRIALDALIALAALTTLAALLAAALAAGADIALAALTARRRPSLAAGRSSSGRRCRKSGRSVMIRAFRRVGVGHFVALFRDSVGQFHFLRINFIVKYCYIDFMWVYLVKKRTIL